MKKLLAILLVGVSMLGLATGTASAWPMRCGGCCGCFGWRCCHPNCGCTCSQYNAFSSWCCDCQCSGPCNPPEHSYCPPLCTHFGDGYANHLPGGVAAVPGQANGAMAAAPGYNPAVAYPNYMAAQPGAGAVQGPMAGYNPMPSYPATSAAPYSAQGYYPGAMGGYGIGGR